MSDIKVVRSHDIYSAYREIVVKHDHWVLGEETPRSILVPDLEEIPLRFPVKGEVLREWARGLTVDERDAFKAVFSRMLIDEHEDTDQFRLLINAIREQERTLYR